MDPTDHPFLQLNDSSPLLNDSELAGLRGGSHRHVCFRRLQSRCLAYVLDYRQYRHLLSIDDGEEIVSQAVVEELRYIEDSLVGAEEVSIRVKRALNRVRARYVRECRRRTSDTAAPIASDDILMAIQYKEVARALRGYIGRAIDALRDRDRNLLIDSYGLERFGLVKRGLSPVFANAGGHKVGLWRARQRFLHELQRLIEAANQNLDLIRSLRILIESGGLAAYFVSTRLEGRVMAPVHSRRVRDGQAESWIR